MTICILCDYPIHTLPGHEALPRGAHATWLPPLSAELAARDTGLDLHWITCTRAVTQPTTIQHHRQTFHLIPRGKLSIEMLTGFHRERRCLRKLLSTLGPDIIHAWGTEQGYALAALDYSPEALISIQGILNVCCRNTRMPWLARLQARHEARALRRARHLTVESPWGRDQLTRFAPQADIQLLEYGAARECFDVELPLRDPVAFGSVAASPLGSTCGGQLPPAAAQCDAAGTPGGRDARAPLAVYVGSISHLKGSDTLLQAFSDPRLAHVQLVVIGNGDPQRLCDPLPPNAHFTGYLPVTDVREWMVKAWCLVHPTRADTSPNAVKEARVIGLPVVTTPDGGQTQYVEHLKSGFIHPAGDVEALIQGVLACTVSRETAHAMGAHGQNRCRQLLHPSTTATRLLEIYADYAGVKF